MSVKTSRKPKAKKKATETRKKTSPDECPPPEDKAAAEKFVRDVVTRGEAAKPDKHGKLPPGATHEITEEREGELPKIERKRFSLY